MNTRTELMFGAEAMQRLQHAHVLVVGLGGVGGAALEMIARAGVGNITIVDADTVNASNINRQLIATNTVLGKPKALAWHERLLDINPNVNITVHTEFLEENNTLQVLQSEPFDYVVDAIDTVSPKVFLLQNCIEQGIPVVSSMGSGGKLDLSKIQIADISKTSYCPLAKVVRQRLFKKGIKHGITCVFSTEEANKNAILEVKDEKYKRTTTGTVSYMPNVFGCWIASHVIKNIAL